MEYDAEERPSADETRAWLEVSMHESIAVVWRTLAYALIFLLAHTEDVSWAGCRRHALQRTLLLSTHQCHMQLVR